MMDEQMGPDLGVCSFFVVYQAVISITRSACVDIGIGKA